MFMFMLTVRQNTIYFDPLSHTPLQGGGIMSPPAAMVAPPLHYRAILRRMGCTFQFSGWASWASLAAQNVIAHQLWNSLPTSYRQSYGEEVNEVFVASH